MKKLSRKPFGNLHSQLNNGNSLGTKCVKYVEWQEMFYAVIFVQKFIILIALI
jgi:hypothetical protein